MNTLFFLPWNKKEGILNVVINQMVLVTFGLHCMEKNCKMSSYKQCLVFLYTITVIICILNKLYSLYLHRLYNIFYFNLIKCFRYCFLLCALAIFIIC